MIYNLSFPLINLSPCMGIVEVTLFFLHSALNIPLHKGVRKLLLSSAELDRSCWFRHTLEYGSSPRNTAPPPGIRLHPQEYGSYGSSHRNMGSCYRNMVLPTQICCCCSVTKSCLTLCNSMDYSMPGSMGFSRQGYWSRLPFPSPRIFSD